MRKPATYLTDFNLNSGGKDSPLNLLISTNYIRSMRLIYNENGRMMDWGVRAPETTPV